LPGCDRIEALSNLLSLIELPERVTRDELLDMLLAREKLASTAAGEGVAIPHPRKPLADLIDKPHVWVARPRDPIDWGSIDQKPVRLVLLVLSCSLKGHLDMLSRIALVMRAPEVRKALEQEPDRDKLCEIIEAHPG
jgi:PTS system nitrogen regulatory IIA component